MGRVAAGYGGCPRAGDPMRHSLAMGERNEFIGLDTMAKIVPTVGEAVRRGILRQSARVGASAAAQIHQGRCTFTSPRLDGSGERLCGRVGGMVNPAADPVTASAPCTPPVADPVTASAPCAHPVADPATASAACAPPDADPVTASAACAPPVADSVTASAACAPPVADPVTASATCAPPVADPVTGASPCPRTNSDSATAVTVGNRAEPACCRRLSRPGGSRRGRYRHDAPHQQRPRQEPVGGERSSAEGKLAYSAG